MTESTRIRVVEDKNAGVNSRWKVDGLKGPDGKRQRKFFPTKGQAKFYAQTFKVRLKNEGLEGLALTAADRAEAASCIAKLRVRGRTLTDATRHYLEYLEREQRTCTIVKLTEEFIPAKRQDGVSNTYLKTFAGLLEKFSETFGARQVSEIFAHEIDDWLRALKIGPVSRNSYRRMMGAFFSYALNRGYAQINPMKRVPKAKEPPAKIPILTPEQTESLLNAADPTVLPALAIAAFAGLRDAEIQRIQWEHIHLNRENPVIEVKAEHAKTQSRRLIPIQANLAAWLEPHRRKSGPISPVGARDLIEIARKNGGLTDTGTSEGKVFPFKNHLRHSFGSYRMPIINDGPRLALEMGNTPQIIFRHYRELVHVEDAQRYWNIFPN